MSRTLPESIKKRIENHKSFEKLNIEYNNSNWAGRPTKFFKEAELIINKEVTRNISSYENGIEILSKLDISDEYLKGIKSPIHLPKIKSQNLIKVRTQTDFIFHFKNKEKEVFTWKNAKTIKRAWAEERGCSDHTISVLLVFLDEDLANWGFYLNSQPIIPIPPIEIDTRIKGFFEFYNLEDHSLSNPVFQRAQLILTDEKKEFIYKSHHDKKIKRAKVIIQKPLNRKTIPITIKQKKFVINFYIKLSRNSGNQHFYAHYIYYSKDEEQYTGYLILKKIPTIDSLLSPARNLIEIPKNIKQFLLDFPINKNPDESLLQGKAGLTPKGKIFDSLKQSIGVYYLYCNKKYEYQEFKETNPNDNKFIGWIGRDIFEIKEGDKSNQLICRLKMHKYPEKTGEIIVEEKQGRAYIICTMSGSNGTDSQFLNLIFYRGTTLGLENFLFGTYNTVYDSINPVGCGLVILQKTYEKNYQDLIPGLINPLFKGDKVLMGEKEEDLDTNEQKIVNHLCLNSKARLGSLREKNELLKNTALNDFSGVFEIYSYGRKRRKESNYGRFNSRAKVITIGALEISPYHFVRHKGDFDREYAEGYVSLIAGNLFITLVNKADGLRTGTFFIRVGSKMPKDENSIFCGTFSGVSPDSGRALGNRIIIKYCPNKKFEDVNTERVNIYSPDINEKVPSEIRYALMGRWVNFINFYERAGIFNLYQLSVENNNQLSLGKRFFQSACYIIIHYYDIVEGVRDLQRSLEHGYGSYQIFESEVKDKIDATLFEKLIDHPTYKDLKILYPIET